MRVKAHMAEMARGMIYARQNTRWNLGFRFLIIYHKLFTRISHGASRLQEVLADRLSAYHYGAQAFEDGLRHVVYREAEFSYMASCEVKAALGAKRSFANFYELVPSEAPQEQKSIQAKYQEAITRVTSETDTHPNPIDRFRYVGRVMSKPCEPAPGMVWDLFSDRQALTAEMHALLENNIRARTV
jgi:Zn-dependent protease with chaperone function